ncbi:MAG: anthrone oxygenase family protein [Bacteroidota bacterium]
MITLKTIFLLAAVLLTGLSAGFFYAWQVSVIPGTYKVADSVYLASMQSINRAILNPAFFLVFMGPMLFLILSTVYHYQQSLPFWFLLAATLLYIGGAFGVTAMGNVPLNDQLDVMQLADLSTQKAAEFRRYYEVNWNRLHLIRTVFAVLSFLSALLALLTYSKT